MAASEGNLGKVVIDDDQSITGLGKWPFNLGRIGGGCKQWSGILEVNFKAINPSDISDKRIYAHAPCRCQ